MEHCNFAGRYACNFGMKQVLSSPIQAFRVPADAVESLEGTVATIFDAIIQIPCSGQVMAWRGGVSSEECNGVVSPSAVAR